MLQVSRMKTEVPLATPPKDHPPAFVLGADEDLIVDVQAVEETAALYHVQPHILQNSAHDVMLVRSIALFQLSLCRTYHCAQSPEAMSTSKTFPSQRPNNSGTQMRGMCFAGHTMERGSRCTEKLAGQIVA